MSSKRRASVKVSDRAYETLHREILDGSIEPGTLLYGVDLAVRLGISRTPVRDALTRLQAEGLVTNSGRGYTVTSVQENDVRALFELRGALESTAAELASRRGASEEFHQFALAFRDAKALLEGSGSKEEVSEYFLLIRLFDRAIDAACDNKYLVDALDSLRMHVTRVRHMAGSSLERLIASAAEHAIIAEAIAAHDPVLTAHATHVHLHNSLEHYRAALAERLDSASA